MAKILEGSANLYEIRSLREFASGVLNQVSALLTETNMAEMNYKVDGEKMEPKDVARDFLKARGVVVPPRSR